MARTRSRRALEELRRFYRRNGYVRGVPDRDESPDIHRGYELRFSALDRKELETILSLLHAAGIRPGRPFRKKTHYRIPVYGLEQVAFLAEELC